MAKRAQQESGEGRVTAKSKPMMNLIARTPSVVFNFIEPGEETFHRSCRLQLHQARGRDGTEIKILGNLLL